MDKETKQITLKLPIELIAALKAEARKIAYEDGRDLSYTDLIRDILATRQAIEHEWNNRLNPTKA